MTPDQNEELQRIKKAVLEGMVPTPDDVAAGYTPAHVLRCRKILDGFLAAIGRLAAPAGEDAILQVLEETVFALNDLNDECGRLMIEAAQRSLLCQLLLGAARNVGLQGEEDVTEAWREW